ncbi:MAG: hypothetical protein Q9214_004847 [Letrouitia sp. 1 TL-2023]
MAGITNINLDNLWTQFETAINNGSANNIELVAAMKNAIGVAGIHFLAVRYEAMIGAPISIINNPQSGSVCLVPAYDLDGHYVSYTDFPKPMQVNKVKVARPPNAFIMYRTYYHPIIKAANPDIHNNSICKLTSPLTRCGLDTRSPGPSGDPRNAMEERERRDQRPLQDGGGECQTGARGDVSGLPVSAAEAVGEEASYDTPQSCSFARRRFVI